MKSVHDLPARKNNVTDDSMPAWVKHGSGAHLHFAVMRGPSSDAWRTYPWLDTSSGPRIKPWVRELSVRCRLGTEVPSVPTRQSKRAEQRNKSWAARRVTDGNKQGRQTRRERRASARKQARKQAQA